MGARTIAPAPAGAYPRRPGTAPGSWIWRTHDGIARSGGSPWPHWCGVLAHWMDGGWPRYNYSSTSHPYGERFRQCPGWDTPTRPTGRALPGAAVDTAGQARQIVRRISHLTRAGFFSVVGFHGVVTAKCPAGSPLKGRPGRNRGRRDRKKRAAKSRPRMLKSANYLAYDFELFQSGTKFIHCLFAFKAVTTCTK